MYSIYCDNVLIYDPWDESLPILAGKISTEVNGTGELTFTLPATHPRISDIHKLISVVRVMNDETELFRGRVLSAKSDLYGTSEFTCEGELAYLLDSIQRPKSYSNLTPRIYLQDKINQHNSQVEVAKQFTLGIVEKQSMNYNAREDNQYTNTLSTIMDKLVESNGGYIRVRRVDGVRYLDYVESYGRTSGQTIRFGENILDLTQHIDASGVITVLIPLGKAPEGAGEGEKLTIASVNGGRDYLESPEAIALYGRISGPNTWDEVTLPENLKVKGEEYLKNMQNLSLLIELTAVDLHLIDVDIDYIQLGDLVRGVSPPHNLDRYLMVTKREYDLLNPSNDRLVLGETLKALTDKQLKIQKNTANQKRVESEIQALGTSVAQVSGTVEKMGEKIQKIDSAYSSVPEQITCLQSEIKKIEQIHDNDFFALDKKIAELLERVETLEGGKAV